MRFEEQFDKLSMAEQEKFKRIVNQLLGHTFVIQDLFDGDEHMRRSNPDYIFVDRNLELFEEYLSFAGFRLEQDTNYGVISLNSSYDYNRQKFDKLTTLMLYVIRLMYEEQRETISLSEVIVTTGEVIHKMLSLGVINKRPPMREIRDALRRLIRFRVLEKIEGSLEEPEAKFIILPTILFIVTNERISVIFEELESGEVELESDEEAFDEIDEPEISDYSDEEQT